MNLIEALKTGKRFTRKSWTESLGAAVWMSSVDGCNLLKKDILADDWEVEETVVPITEGWFDAAWQRAVTSYPSSGPWLDAFMPTLKKELGL